MNDEVGWVSIHRSLFSNPIWKDKPFARGQAWVDLIMLANHDDQSGFRRGCVNRSMLFLADRWGWTRKKTAHFFKMLEKSGMVEVNCDRHGSTIFLVNYDKYQGTTKGTTEGTTETLVNTGFSGNQGTTEGTTEGTQTIKSNKSNNYSTTTEKKKRPSSEEVSQEFHKYPNLPQEKVQKFMDCYDQYGWPRSWKQKVRQWSDREWSEGKDTHDKPKETFYDRPCSIELFG